VGISLEELGFAQQNQRYLAVLRSKVKVQKGKDIGDRDKKARLDRESIPGKEVQGSPKIGKRKLRFMVVHGDIC
jgi:hypothetical protein